ncbi:MAG: ribonuclease III [Bilifractor sp.]|jgi:ribonuclease-3
MEEKLSELQQKIGCTFADVRWLELALRHSSYANEHNLGHEGCNERLEFLGDAVLELVSSEYLYDHYPELPEGQLTKLRASLVCEPTLAYDARQFGLENYLLLGKGEDATGGRKRDSVVSDALEAVIGAIFKDGGFEKARAFILRYVMDDVEHKQLFHDSKTHLQEMIQAVSEEPIRYEITGETGPDHNKKFTAQVWLGARLLGEGSGHSKKAAEQQAAYQAIMRFSPSDFAAEQQN